MFPRRDIGVPSNSCVPPDAFCFFPILGEQQFKTALTIIAWLMPAALPQTVCKFRRDELSSLLGVWSVAGLVERGLVAFVVFYFQNIPLATQVDAGRD